MEHNALNKTAIILYVFLALLIIAFFIQGRKLTILKVKAGEIRLAENSRTDIEKGGSLLDKNLSSNDENEYKKKIKKLEATLSAMQERVDNQEDILDGYYEKTESPNAKKPETSTVVHVDYSRDFEDFFEENNFSPGTKEKLNDLYVERHNRMNEYFNESQKADIGNNKVNPEAANKLMALHNEIQSDFNSKLTDLLGEAGVAALKEYEAKGNERSFIDDFQRMLGDEKLEKDKKKELIALMYSERQAVMEEESKKPWPYASAERYPDKETLAKIQKASFERGQERDKKVYRRYGSVAEGILSESQMMKFEGFVNMRIKSLDDTIFITDN